MTKPKKLLIITSSGGGGLIQTANAKEQEYLAKDPNLVVVRRDLLKDWAPFSNFMINFWNKAQKSGRVWVQMIGVKGQFIADFFFFPYVFYHTLSTLFREDVDYIIDTQPMATSAIVRALRIFNRKRKKNIRVEKILVDLPTKKATHFFRPIKKLSAQNRKLVRLTSIAPLLDEGESAEQFWQTTCGLSEKEVNCEEVYVRHAFQQYKNKPRPEKSISIQIQTKNEEEIDLMQNTFKRGSVKSKIKGNTIEFEIAPDDQMVTILLGSQPAAEATINYVKKFISIIKEAPKVTTHLFAFCADHKAGEKTLFWEVANLVRKIEDYPENLSIIPFSFQNENVIAPLLYRADITCTRSGGQTAMELMCVSTGEIWIHSESKKGEDLLRGIPGWEAASAVYLQRLHGARIVTPDIFVPEAQRILQTKLG